MSTDLTPVILITNGEQGLVECRFAIVLGWDEATKHKKGKRRLNTRFLAAAFIEAEVVKTIKKNRRRVTRQIRANLGRLEQHQTKRLRVLDLTRGKKFTYRDLLEHAESVQRLYPDPRYEL